MVELIYGENHSGKSLYKKYIGTNWVWIDQEVFKWKIQRKDINAYSHYDYIVQKWRKQILENQTKIFSKNSSLNFKFPGVDIQKIEKFINDRSNNFSSFKQWLIYYAKSKSLKTINFDNKTIMDFYDLLINNKDLVASLSNTDIEKFSIIKSLDNVLYLPKMTKLNAFIRKKEMMKNELIKKFGLKNFVLVNRLSIANLRLLFTWKEKNRSLELMAFELRNSIKKMILDSDEFKNILKYTFLQKEELKSAFIFDPALQYVSDNGRVLELNKRLSSSVSIMQVILAVAKTVELKGLGALVIDDIFELLDSKHEEILILWLSEINIKLQILVRKVSTLNNIQNVLHVHQIPFLTKTIKTIEDENKGKKVSFKKEHRNGYILTFQKLNQELIEKGTSTKFKNFMLLFSRIFGRYTDLAGALANNADLNNPILTSNYEYYKYTSTNILHYEPKINLKHFNEMFGTDFKYRKYAVDTVKLLDLMISRIRKIPKESGFGLRKEKIIRFLNLHRDCICAEREIWKSKGYPNEGETKHQFIRRNWPKDKVIFGLTRLDRNRIDHELDNSLMELI